MSMVAYKPATAHCDELAIRLNKNLLLYTYTMPDDNVCTETTIHTLEY